MTPKISVQFTENELDWLCEIAEQQWRDQRYERPSSVPHSARDKLFVARSNFHNQQDMKTKARR